MIEDLPQNHFGAILADPPWHWKSWSEYADNPKAFSQIIDRGSRACSNHYGLMSNADIEALPVRTVSANNSVLFLWFCWPQLEIALKIIKAWGFTYKTCAFSWMKADVSTVNMFNGPRDADMGLGYWTRSNSEVCLLATRGKPKRKDAGVRQGIIEPAREHSRKPDCVYERIERLVDGPYLELFARTERPGWTSWGNETKKFKPMETEHGLV
jgi:N6-adenosine-specific RNA methylase IME4